MHTSQREWILKSRSKGVTSFVVILLEEDWVTSACIESLDTKLAII